MAFKTSLSLPVKKYTLLVISSVKSDNVILEQHPKTPLDCNCAVGLEKLKLCYDLIQFLQIMPVFKRDSNLTIPSC